MRRVLLATAAVVGMALSSCSAPPPAPEHPSTTSPMSYEPSAPVVRAPLSPPIGYSSPPSLTNFPTSLTPYGDSPNENVESDPAAHGWHASPPWAAVQGQGCIVVEQDAKNTNPVQADAAKVKVENSSRGDEDLCPSPPEEVSGY